VPPKVALPLIEHATIEHEEELHDLFANLLATGMDPSGKEIHRKYVTTLAEMTADDAFTLASMYQDSLKEISKRPSRNSDTVVFGPGIDGTHSYDEISVVTLNRLGLIEPAYVSITTYAPGGANRYGEFPPSTDEAVVAGGLESVNLTTFGMAFCKAVGMDDDVNASPESK
jgi:hypothetical protein